MMMRPVVRVTALLAGALAAGSPGPPAAAERYPSVRQAGATVMIHQDDTVLVALGHKYASLHPEARFLLLDLAVTAEGSKEVALHREMFALRTPGGAGLPMTTQKRINESWSEVGPMLRAARVAADPLGLYFKARDEVQPIRFFVSRQGGALVEDRLAVNNRVYARGPILFESPAGAWAPGLYVLTITGEQIRVDIPFAIPRPRPRPAPSPER